MSATRTCAQTEHIVGQLLATIPRHGGRGNLLREEIRGVVAGCLDLVARDQPHPTARVSRIHRAAGRWAAVGVPIETVHGMVREGFRLTRPGPGRDRLIAVLDPLVAHPELLRTLRVHVRNDLNRRLTARALHIHQNTVDHRLERIGVLVGLESTRPTSLWRLRAALVARSYTHPDEPGPDD